jgi:uncharacterized membrane protein
VAVHSIIAVPAATPADQLSKFLGKTNMQFNDMQEQLAQLRDRQGTIATAAALAAGATLLLAWQLRERQPSAPVRALELVQDQILRRPGWSGPIAALALGGLLWSQLRNGRAAGGSSSMESSIEVDVPVRTAYNQWTQFEEFPRFMDGVEEVRQIDDTHQHWRAKVAGKTKEWDAEITEQIPDQRIAWRSTGGVRNSGVVSFHRIADSRTRVVLRMDYEPETMGEKIGDALGGVKLTAKDNLLRFKSLIEGRGVESGAWRGTVAQGAVTQH